MTSSKPSSAQPGASALPSANAVPGPRLLEVEGFRPWCMRCRRPAVTCLCRHMTILQVRTKFVFLMHPMEARRTKNGSGRIAHLALPGSELLIGIDFTHHPRVAELLADPAYHCRLLYPEFSGRSAPIPAPAPPSATPVVIILDATWPCAKKMARLSTNLHDLPRLSLDIDRPSEFHIKRQPHPSCLATIEAVDRTLHALAAEGLEQYGDDESERLLRPFHAMVQMELDQVTDPTPRVSRYKKTGVASPRRLPGRKVAKSGRNVVYRG